MAFVLLYVVDESCADAQASKPNVLFILIDDLKPTIGSFGDEYADTPHIDRLASRGTAFLNAHCQQAVCAPSRVSLLLGQRPDATRVWDLKTRFRSVLPDAVTLPQRFKRAGYRAVGMGKVFDGRSTDSYEQMDRVSWSEPFVHIDSPADITFTYRDPETVRTIEAAQAQPDYPDTRKARLAYIFPDGQPITDRAEVPDNAYDDGMMTDLAVERLQGFANTGESFFLAVGFRKPHLPFNAPDKYWARYDRDRLPVAALTQPPVDAPEFAFHSGHELRRQYAAPKDGPIHIEMQRELIHGYYAAVSYIDAQVGRLIDALDQHGLSDNTIIVLLGDHGWHLGDHAIWCKHTNYEQATRSPLIIAGTGVGAAEEKPTAPVELIDIYPTLLDLAGLEPEGELHGTSLRPMLEDPSSQVKDVAISQYPRRAMWMGYAFRGDRYRLVEWYVRDPDTGLPTDELVATELYDYEAQPLEPRNLAADPTYGEALGEMKKHANTFYESMSGHMSDGFRSPR